MRYYQCSKCKELKSLNPKMRKVKKAGNTHIVIDPDQVKEDLVCCGRRMRELAGNQYRAEIDHKMKYGK